MTSRCARARLWGKAGQRSLQRSALVEAAEQLKRALAQINTLPAASALRREAIKLQVAFATVLFHVKGYTAPETIDAFERADARIAEAETLGERQEDELLRFSVLYGQWTGNHTAGNLVSALEVAKHFLAVAETQPLSAPLLMAHRVIGATLCLLGQFATARQHLDRAVMLYCPKEHEPLATKFGQDIGVAALTYRAFALYRLGYPESALKDVEEALSFARELGQFGTLACALLQASVVNFLCGTFAITEARVEELNALAEKYGLAYWKDMAGMFGGWVFAATNRGDGAVKLISQSLSGLSKARTTMFLPFSLMWLARAHVSCGRFAEAQDAISRAIDSIEKTKERWDEAEVLRTAGEIARLGPSSDAVKAETYLARALAVARLQNAKSWELRAAMSMARLWRDQGKRSEARDLLAMILGWFNEGFHLPDLVEAEALLEELG
jgi:predicted ATPase